VAKTAVSSANEALKRISQGLRNAAVRPNLIGYVPHEKQLRFHQSEARRKLYIGGNRAGKTVGGAVEMDMRLTGKHRWRDLRPPPISARVVAVDFDHGVEKIVKPEIARWLPPSELINGSWEDSYSKQLKTLTLANGSTLEFMSYEQEVEKFAGTSRDAVWFDEEPPKDIYTECLLRTLDVAGDVWITMTPIEGMTWVYDDLYLAAATDPMIEVIEVDVTENPHINAAEIDALFSGMDSDDKDARRHGRFVQVGGLIYKQFGDHNLLDPFIPPREWLHVASLDHGLNNPTAWLWAAVNRDGDIVIYDEHYYSGEVVSWHAAEVHKKNLSHGRVPDYYVGDPSIRNSDPITGTSVQIEYVKYGIPVILGNNDVHAGINLVSSRLRLDERTHRPRLFITRNCVNTIREIQRYRWATWASKKHIREKNKKEEPHKKDDHAMDSIRYLVASRPEMGDDSTYIPEFVDPRGASEAVNPYDAQVDTSLRDNGTEHVDDLLGSEW
jgi:phage terminase large subunit-like protein